ncbi:MAG: hypothetical protein ABL860_05275 [Candidatus Nitrotoga sp.]
MSTKKILTKLGRGQFAKITVNTAVGNFLEYSLPNSNALPLTSKLDIQAAAISKGVILTLTLRHPCLMLILH